MHARVVAAAGVGAIVLAVLEAVTYGILLPEFIDANRVHYPGLIKNPPDPVPYLLFNLVWCSLLVFVFDRWAGIRTFSSGALCGAAIMVAVVLGINFGYLAFFNLLQNSALVILVKVIAMAITGAVAGGVMGVMLRNWTATPPKMVDRSA